MLSPSRTTPSVSRGQPPPHTGALALGLAHVIMAEGFRAAADAGQAGTLVEGWADGLPAHTPEEVEAVRGTFDRLTDGSATWVDQHGDEHTVDLEQVLVVAPYNVQVNALRDALPDGARVGTVDKFQGQQAAVVLYSLAASSAQDAPRGMDFLFNANRLNVATSRARCVAVVIASPALVAPDCNSLRQMQLANGICRFRELAEGDRPRVAAR